jgi:WD40 repeat protein
MKGKMVKQNGFILLVVLMVLFAGCYIPPISRQSRISEEDLKPIVVGTTTKAEIYDLLGKPNFLENARYCVYEVKNWHGGFFLQYDTADFGSEIYRILLEFNKNNTLIYYAVEKGVNAERPIRYYYIHRKIAISPNGKTLAVLSPYDTLSGFDYRVLLFDLETKKKFEFNKEDSRFTEIAFSPYSRYLVLIGHHTKVIDISNPSKAFLFKGHGEYSNWSWNPKRVTCLAFFPDGKTVVTGGSRGFVKIWELSTGTEIMTFKVHEGKIESIEISPDGKFIATGSGDNIRIWDFTTGNLLDQMTAETDRIGGLHRQCAFKFSPDGKLFAINRGTHVELWNINQKKNYGRVFKSLVNVFLLPVFDETSLGSIQPSLDFSRDGLILAASFGSMVVYNIDNMQSIWSYNFKSLPNRFKGVSYPDRILVKYGALHPNGKLLFIYTDEGISHVDLK